MNVRAVCEGNSKDGRVVEPDRRAGYKSLDRRLRPSDRTCASLDEPVYEAEGIHSCDAKQLEMACAALVVQDRQATTYETS